MIYSAQCSCMGWWRRDRLASVCVLVSFARICCFISAWKLRLFSDCYWMENYIIYNWGNNRQSLNEEWERLEFSQNWVSVNRGSAERMFLCFATTGHRTQGMRNLTWSSINSQFVAHTHFHIKNRFWLALIVSIDNILAIWTDHVDVRYLTLKHNWTRNHQIELIFVFDDQLTLDAVLRILLIYCSSANRVALCNQSIGMNKMSINHVRYVVLSLSLWPQAGN
jgi:hypothetical protein